MGTLTQPQSPAGGPSRPSTAGPATAGSTTPTTGAVNSARISRGGLVVVGVAVLSLLLALGSMLVAWRALDQARDAKDIALSGGSAADDNGPVARPSATTGAPAPPPTVEPSLDDTPQSPGAPPALNERTAYEQKYTKRQLTLSARSCGRMYADVDEPVANVGPDGHDIEYAPGGCGNEAASLRLGENVDGTEDALPGMTPKECDDKIKSAPIPEDGRVPVRKGVVICVETDYAAARARGDQWRVVLIEIVAVGNDGAVTIQLDAWNIPG